MFSIWPLNYIEKFQPILFFLPFEISANSNSIHLGSKIISSQVSEQKILRRYFSQIMLNLYKSVKRKYLQNQRLPGACNRSPGSKLLSITTQLHCCSHLGGRARLADTILEEDHPMTIPSKFGSNWATGSRQDGFYVNFP